MQEVQVGSAERRDLILLRNQLVTLLRASQNIVMSAEDSQQIAAPALPPPINHHSACSKCPYLTICSSALRLASTLNFHTSPQVRVVCSMYVGDPYHQPTNKSVHINMKVRFSSP